LGKRGEKVLERRFYLGRDGTGRDGAERRARINLLESNPTDGRTDGRTDRQTKRRRAYGCKDGRTAPVKWREKERKAGKRERKRKKEGKRTRLCYMEQSNVHNHYSVLAGSCRVALPLALLKLQHEHETKQGKKGKKERLGKENQQL
jgi:hypothetical protein